MYRVVAIVGSATSTRNLAPIGDPAVEIWSMNDCWQFLPGDAARLWFEMHDREWFTGPNRPEGHLEWLRKAPMPVFMPEAHEDIPSSVAYPEEQIVADLGARRYFTSTLAHMLALACHDLKPKDELHLFGVDLMTDSEYGAQRPCAEYWCGRLEAKGVTVVTPKACPLLRGARYGKPDPDAPKRIVQQRTIEERIRLLTAEKARLGAEFNRNQGRMDEAHYMRTLLVDR